MGCDIHLYVEKRINGVWVKQEGMLPDSNWDIDKLRGVDEVGNGTDEPYSGRNYTVFAALANVRNGVGFAGWDTGDAIVPVDMPRGLPTDVSAGVASKAKDWDGDGHSHSWLTLADLKAYNWDAPLTSRGTIPLEQFKKLKPGEQPDEWSGGVWGTGVVMVEPEQAATYVPKAGEEAFVRIQWVTPLRNACNHFLKHLLPQLQALAGKDNTSVRIVFWFDN